MARAKKDSSEFYVRFDGVKLPKAAEERIAEAIQAAALAEFVKLDIAPNLVPIVPPWQVWHGIYFATKRIALDGGLQVPPIDEGSS